MALQRKVLNLAIKNLTDGKMKLSNYFFFNTVCKITSNLTMTSFYINPVYESEQTHRGFFLKHTEISGSFSSDITKQNYRDVSGMQI